MGVTLITGASSGIGQALAERLARRGETVALLARRSDRLTRIVQDIEADGGRALAVSADVSQPRALAEAVERIERELGPVTRLIANAGGGQPTFVDRLDGAEVAEVVTLNLLGVVYSVEAVLPGMLARGHGHLVAVGSLAGRRGLPTGAAYSAAKAGVANFMESLRIDLKGRGVDVTLIEPGFVDAKNRPASGKRRKPLQMPLARAAARMERAILARRARFAFPWWMVWASRALEALPATCYDWVMSGRGRKMP